MSFNRIARSCRYERSRTRMLLELQMFKVAISTFALLVVITAPLSSSVAKDSASAAKVYEGVVGSSPIIMSLERADDSVSGSYFYRTKRFDIELYGDEKNGAIRLESSLTGDKFKFKPDGSGYSGSLTTAKGKTLPVHMKAVENGAAGAPPADAGDDLDLYEKLRLSGLELKPQRVEAVSGRMVRWYMEPVSGARLFRIESGYAAPAMDAMNKALARIQWSNVSEYFGCPGSDGGAGVENSEVRNLYLSDAYVSFSIDEAWSCAGAAHPDFGMEGHSFDARTGKEIELDEILKFGNGSVPRKDSEAWLDYRGSVFAHGVIALLKRAHPREMTKPHDGDGCDYSNAEVWDFPSWRMTEKGLYLGASFPRVERNCDNPDWSVIPYATLKASQELR